MLVREFLRDGIWLMRTLSHVKAAVFNPRVEFAVVALEHLEEACAATTVSFAVMAITDVRPNPGAPLLQPRNHRKGHAIAL